MQIQISLSQLFSDEKPIIINRMVAEIQVHGLQRVLTVSRQSDGRYRVVGASLHLFWALQYVYNQRREPFANDLIPCYLLR